MKTCCKRTESNLTGIQDSLRDLFNAQLQLGKEVVNLIGEGVGSALRSLGGMSLPRLRGSSCCDIPEPCWMPRSAGEFFCSLRPGDEGTLCIIVTNEDFRAHPYTIELSGSDASNASASPASFQLGCKQSRTSKVTFTVPAERKDRSKRCDCVDYEVVVWVRGCRNYYVRWQIKVSDQPQPCCYEAEVKDDPNYVLHWYDHFYLIRPCFGPQVKTD